MERCKTIKQLKKEFDSINKGLYGPGIYLNCETTLFIAEKMERIESLLYQLTKQTMRMNALLSRKGKRNPTPYQLKVGRFLKEGKSLQEAHRLARGE
ncbi:hypothetical protein ES703_86541 [subsurface metagenome]